jgi:hypothetical protein
MKIRIVNWPIEKCNRLKDRINPKPQFQRTEVWSEPKKRLLIDSILRGYDVPKIYLNRLSKNVHHDYEVADGQQRLRALWSFIAGGYNLDSESADINGENLQGFGFEDLPAKVRNKFLSYKVTVSLIVTATSDELRMLFARLQMGMKLTPAELRNATACAIGPVINTIVETHAFFLESRIPDKRFNRQDFLAHAMLLAQHDNKHDLKAPQLKEYYENQARSYDKGFVKKVMDVLDELAAINNAADRCIVTKWGFVDLFWLIFQAMKAGRKIDHKKLAVAYAEFESLRIPHVRTPHLLLSSKSKSKKEMYSYIQAFTASGAVRDRIDTRAQIFHNSFTKFIK